MKDHQLGVHIWIDVTQSRNLSDASAYVLTLLQSSSGLGVHYTTDSISTYFRLGNSGSSARFKATSGRSPVPILPTGGGDIFVPPISIFSRSRSQTTYTNREDGTVGKVDIRYSLLEKYEVSAAVQWSNIDSFGTEFSAYIQKDFESSSVRTRTTFGPGLGYMSIRVNAKMDDNTKSVGLSLVYSF